MRLKAIQKLLLEPAGEVVRFVDYCEYLIFAAWANELEIDVAGMVDKSKPLVVLGVFEYLG
jgi:hypothetical protein